MSRQSRLDPESTLPRVSAQEIDVKDIFVGNQDGCEILVSLVEQSIDMLVC